MSEEAWAERGTTPDRIESGLRALLRQRFAADQRIAPARVLNLVVIVDREWKGEIANRLERVGRYHASRTILCAVEAGRRSLDAWALLSDDRRTDGGIGVIREQVEIDMGPEHLRRIDTIVDPVIASELPTVLWSPHGHEEAVRTLLGLIDVVLLDSDDVDNPSAALARSAVRREQAYVVDLAWLRTTPWRERMAACFDPPARRGALARLDRIAVRHHPSSTASALLLSGWLASRLGWETGPLEAEAGDGVVGVELAPVGQDVPGIAGLTVFDRDGYSLSLDRGRGGLQAVERENGSERAWRILGASRGEGGILGEGIRQGLLRDPTYGPALDAARSFCP